MRKDLILQYKGWSDFHILRNCPLASSYFNLSKNVCMKDDGWSKDME